MKKIPVTMLRLNLGQVLDAVGRGETYIVTRRNREVARLVPPEPVSRVTPEQFHALLRASPLAEDWATELRDTAAEVDDSDPWHGTP